MILDINDLVKVYRGGHRANDGITLSVAPGEVFGLLGPNGAGKSTLVRQVMGLAAPTSGSITLDGCDVVRHPQRAREIAAFQPQSSVPIDGLTPRQAIGLVGRMRGSRKRQVSERADVLADALALTEWMDKPGQSLSGGVKRLVGFCMAAATPGRLVILDEPTNDIDPVRRRYLWEQIRLLADSGVAVLLVTHNVLEAERAVDRLAIVDRGRVVASGTPAELRGTDHDSMRLELTLHPDVQVPAAPAGIEPFGVGRRVRAVVARDRVSSAISWAEELRAAHIAEEFSLAPTSLEDSYVRLVGAGADAVDGDSADTAHAGPNATADSKDTDYAAVA